ncbi:hypothetical protein HELRODRAFT_75421, partial [Helobdella robusta]|uniref:Guanylate cyclase domain-containing protein n=1 Tax=Helobdella robusta TaxID=6412 RepID=T1G249_HELRO
HQVADQLMNNQTVDAKHFESVTIYFSDIVGFTEISAASQPIEIVYMLNSLYSGFDGLIEKFDVYKVETIGDAYMVAGGVPKPTTDHMVQISDLALCLMTFTTNYVIPHMPERRLLLRIGLHTGSVVAGVVGLKMPRYCLFGDTVNTASRMESSGQPKRIHISKSTKEALDPYDKFLTEPREATAIKGKGVMQTYWLLGIKNAPTAAGGTTSGKVLMFEN